MGSDEARIWGADGKRILNSRRYEKGPTNKLNQTTIHHSMTYGNRMNDEIRGYQNVEPKIGLKRGSNHLYVTRTRHT